MSDQGMQDMDVIVLRTKASEAMRAVRDSGIDMDAVVREMEKQILPIGTTMKEVLDHMGEDLGQENFRAVIGGASASALIDRWTAERTRKNCEMFSDKFEEALKAKGVPVDRASIVAMVTVMMIK